MPSFRTVVRLVQVELAAAVFLFGRHIGWQGVLSTWAGAAILFGIWLVMRLT